MENRKTDDASNKAAQATHPVVHGDGKPNEGAGKFHGLVDPPVVSTHPSSKPSQSYKADERVRTINKALDFSAIDDNHKEDVYPFHKLEVGAALFVPTGEGRTTDKLIIELKKAAYNARMLYAEIETDEDGNELLEHLTQKISKKNDDGTYELSAETGKPLFDANFIQRPKYIYPRNFVVKAQIKGDKVGSEELDEDGVSVVRIT